MDKRLPVFIGNQAVAEFLRYCQGRSSKDFLLVADENTYKALGQSVDESLRARGYDVLTVVLKGEEVLANEHFLVRVLLKYDRQARTFVAVGSGTITDITRFTSHRVGREFICLPTAPSVDGFTSIGAPLVVGGLKQTIICQPPAAVFADLPTLAAAPRRMIASGFGDLVGKYISIADWKLGHLLWNERFDEGIAGRMLGAAQDIAAHVQDIAGGSVESIRILTDGLIESGFGMLEFGNTSPAGGAEHHMAHHWEMMMLSDHRHAALHGAKVGIASIIAAAWYAEVRKMSKEDAYRRLEKARLPDPKEEALKIRAIFGPIADELLPTQKDFIDMTGAQFEAVKARIVDHWQEVHEIASSVPPAGDFTRWLRMLGGPVDAGEVNLSAEEVRLAKDYSHYMRKRFTINKLRLLLGIS
jgi:glycerol-1-phosphate dehydrogenase [NAD(P)+]